MTKGDVMETGQDPIQSGKAEVNPSRDGKRRTSKSPYANPTRPVRKNESPEIDNEEAEINPAKFDREQTEPDQEGSDDSKAHEPYELKKVEQGKLVGQGGYGTSATSGTNSGENEG
jgi:hypothetical protein